MVGWRTLKDVGNHGKTCANRRAITSFILVLLSKQGWCLLTRPHSLIARVIEAKYYPLEELQTTHWVTNLLIFGEAFRQQGPMFYKELDSASEIKDP